MTRLAGPSAAPPAQARLPKPAAKAAQSSKADDEEDWEPADRAGSGSGSSSGEDDDDQMMIIPEDADTLDPAVGRLCHCLAYVL